jgi:YidC/Oxa1 family membrane protein insertase
MTSFFYHILTQPLVNLLVLFYNTIALRDLGLAIIALTLFIRLLLFPLFHKSTRQQIILQRLQPRIKEIQKEYKDDRVKQTELMMALYAEHNVNPFSGFLFLLLQIPILIALYRIFLTRLFTGTLGGLYSFVANPGALNATFFGLINLHDKSILMVVLAAVLQYFQARIALPPKSAQGSSPAEATARNMVFVAPVMTLVIFYNFPAAVSLYWIVSSLFTIIQQMIINKQLAHLRTSP